MSKMAYNWGGFCSAKGWCIGTDDYDKKATLTTVPNVNVLKFRIAKHVYSSHALTTWFLKLVK